MPARAADRPPRGTPAPLLVLDEAWWSSDFAEVWDDHVWLPEQNPAAGLDHVAAWLAGEEYDAAWRARQEAE